ncbi:MAG: VPDSG-CTERM sorting domain-containing protein [Verrucomicrobiae bacterium]|nr:VPDSG-CTERM sorting domain-containing protein [Verrucomicrobiae bacterium]
MLVGIGGHGNVALTSPGGELNLQDMGVYADADIGLRLAAPKQGSRSGSRYNKSSNSFFNDPNNYPNLLDGTQVAANGGGANVADQSTRIDAPNNAGVTFGFDHSALISELEAARTSINGLAATAILDVSKNGGVLSTFENGKKPKIIDLNGGTAPVLSHQYFNDGTSFKYDIKLTLESGLNVIDIVTERDGNSIKLGKDFEIKETNFIVDGPVDAFVIFRLLEGSDMKISQANVLMGQNIGMNNILFYADNENNDTHFDFNNTIINGAAFWSLGNNGGVININNAQGCTQLIADTISLDDVRFNRCAFGEMPMTVPDAGSSLALLAISALGIAAIRRKSAA